METIKRGDQIILNADSLFAEETVLIVSDGLVDNGYGDMVYEVVGKDLKITNLSPETLKRRTAWYK